ncbi:hypothetical protein D3C72_2286110 [compost metagenome]
MERSCAVAVTEMEFVPTPREIAPEGEPLATGLLLTETVAPLSVVVGVTFSDETLLGTLTE